MNGSGHLLIWMIHFPKELLEELYQRMDDIDSGKVKTYPAEDILKILKERVEEDNNE